MVLGLNKADRSKAPAKVVLRNQAVQAVGERYFQVALAGLVAAGVLAIVAVSIGSARGLFEFRIDRCDCLLSAGAQEAVDEGQECVFGQDMLGVNIGWKSFVIDDAFSTEGCLDEWSGTTDIGSPFGDGIYRKKSAVYGNGATGAADACVGLFVVSAFICIVMYKTVKMSYVGPGSIYSIGLHNIAMMCFLLSVASAISVAAFWGRVQGKVGSLGDSLAGTLFKAVLDVCEGDWDTVGFPIGEEVFCEAAPWSFEVPLYASWTAIAHVAVMFLTSVWILSKSAFVEGILDGSKLTDGKPVTPRVVEFENAVGRALATYEDPDYDVPDNKLYTGEQKIMIRPYPLPGTVKQKPIMKAAEALVSPLRQMGADGKQHGKHSTAEQQAMERGLRHASIVGEGDSDSPQSIGSGHRDFEAGSELLGAPDAFDGSQGGLPSPGPVRPLPKAASPASKKASKKAAKKAAKSKGSKDKGDSSPRAEEGQGKDKPGHGRKGSRSMPKIPGLGSFRRKGNEPEVDPLPRKSSQLESPRQADDGGDDDDLGGSSSSVVLVPEDDSGPGRGHGKTRSEIDWSRIMASDDNDDGAANDDDGGDGGGGSPGLSSGMLGGLDMIFQGPSVKDGLTLGAITEDPREDVISEFTMSPRKRQSQTEFEV
eukprot:g11513.t1